MPGQSAPDSTRLMEAAIEFFRETVFPAQLANIRKLHLKDFVLNPFLEKYKAAALGRDITPETVAEALVIPRVLGTSLTTSFGSRAQKLITAVAGAVGSGVSGLDVEYTDRLTGEYVYCQIKAGPNNINKDDVQPMLAAFSAARRLLRTNNSNVRPEQFVVGVLYGDDRSLSSSFKTIRTHHPVYVGQRFWEGLTGEPTFYDELSDQVGEVGAATDVSEAIDDAIRRIAIELSGHPGFDFD